MKINVVPAIVLIAIGCFNFQREAQAATIFDENFESSAYNQGTGFHALPTGFGVINYGGWLNLASGAAGVLTNDEASLSPTHSLILDRLFETEPGNAQVLGYFGTTNAGPATSFSTAMVFSMAFRLTGPTTENYSSIAIRNSVDTNLGYAFFGLNGDLIVGSGLGGSLLTVASISTDTWYNLEFVMPDSTGTTYTVNLYGADGLSLLGSQTAGITGAFGDGYTYFTAGNGTAGSAVYLDNISASTVPEPGTWAMVAFSVLVIFGRPLYRKCQKSLAV